MVVRPDARFVAARRVTDGQPADLAIRRGVQKCEQPGQSFMRMGGLLRPAAEQQPLGGDVDDGSAERRLPTWAKRSRQIDDDESAAPGPAEERAQHVRALVTVLRSLRNKCVQVGSGHLGPASHRAGRRQVNGEITQDPKLHLDAGVAEHPPASTPGRDLPLDELHAGELGDRRGQAFRDGVEIAAAPVRGPALALITGQGQAAADEERLEGAGRGARGAAGQQLLGAGGRLGDEQTAGFAQDGDRATRMVTCRNERNQIRPPGWRRLQPDGQRLGVAEGTVRVSEVAPVAQAVPDVAPLLSAALTTDRFRRFRWSGCAHAPGADARWGQMPENAAAWARTS